MRFPLLAAAAAFLATCFSPAAPRALAGDHFLTLGGGWNPEGNQVSLERNVIYLQRVLQQLGLADAPHEILFADGSDPARDLQFTPLEPLNDPPGQNLRDLLARVVGPSRGIDYRYRNSEIPGVKGAATLTSLDRWFNNTAWRLGDSDRLLMYVPMHGGKARQKESQNTLLYLWGGPQLTMRDFVQRLDKVPHHVPVVLVMVQCYAGGFANVIFEGGDPKAELDEHNRCGFFATVHDRPAAGCTPDVNEAEYQEYSSYFWAALCGVNRLGEPVEKPDYDGDGRTSFLEAHAYSLIRCDSTDIPVKTSDAFLRRFSATTSTASSKGRSSVNPRAAELLTASSPLPQLLANASPIDRAVIDGLSQRLGLTGNDRAKAAKQKADKSNADRSRLDADYKRLQRDAGAIKRVIADEVKLRWPELATPWHAEVPRILETDGEKIRRTIERHRDYGRWIKLAQQSDDVAVKMEDLERQWAKCQRVIRVLENVALEANLERIATPEIAGQYAELLRRESGTLK